MRKYSTYKLNEDLSIDCIIDDSGYSKVYSVEVVFTPLGIPIEEVRGMVNKDEANKCFQQMVRKYR